MKQTTLIVGPTASGKSALALAFARRVGGSIINADSMQVYEGLPILTAQPSGAEQDVPHHLYGYVTPPNLSSVSSWIQDARVLANDCDRPILVGGSGLYIKGFLEGLSPMPDVPQALRDTIRAYHGEVGTAKLYEDLKSLDPGVAVVLKPGDTQRIIRAYEVMKATGQSILYWQNQKGQAYAGQTKIIFINPPVAELNARISKRFDVMIEVGALDEVADMMARDVPFNHPALKAIGYSEIKLYLEGSRTLDDARERAIIASRQYAKRQRTWFRHQIVADIVIDRFPEEGDICL